MRKSERYSLCIGIKAVAYHKTRKGMIVNCCDTVYLCAYLAVTHKRSVHKITAVGFVAYFAAALYRVNAVARCVALYSGRTDISL